LAVSIERLGAWLLVILLGAAVAHRVRSQPIRWALAALTATLGVLPIGRLSAVDVVYSVTGPLSAASLILGSALLSAHLRPDVDLDSVFAWRLLAVLVLPLAIGVEVFELFISNVDLYRFGYASPAVAIAGIVLVAVGWQVGAVAVAIWVAIGNLLFLITAYDSRNLFDYLIDPVAIVLAFAVIVALRPSRRVVGGPHPVS
jgi:hypothetical protein